jgi:heme-degrading monooxygenase HmoA
MYARVFKIQVDTNRIDDGIEIYEDGYVPEAMQQLGFRGAILLGDRTTGKGMAISMWESEADARATEQSGFVQQVLGRFTELFTEPPSMEGYEIMVKADFMARTA